MVFYEINYCARPKIKFAMSTTTSKYKLDIKARPGIIEIGTIEGSDILFQTGNARVTVPSKSIVVVMPDLPFSGYQLTNDNITISTVGMFIPDIKYITHDVSDFNLIADIVNDPKDNETLFLPQYLPLDVECLHVTAIIKNLINHYIQNTPSDNCQCLAKWYELLGVLSKIFCNYVNEKATKNNVSSKYFSSTYFYMNKAKKFINKHFCENISIADIAQNLGISPNYLSTIFKADTGMTINEFINILRVQKIRELLLDDTMTLERIAASVGLRDIRYMQRLFKKHYGVSMQRCKLIDREISIYGPKPWDAQYREGEITGTPVLPENSKN